MALVKIGLTYAERHLISTVLNDLPKVDIGDLNNMSELYSTLELRDIRKKFEAMAEEAMKANKPMRWADIIEFDAEKKFFTLDSVYVKWLSEILNERNWNSQVVVNQATGERKEHEVPISLDQGITIAGLVDALRTAEPVKK